MSHADHSFDQEACCTFTDEINHDRAELREGLAMIAEGHLGQSASMEQMREVCRNRRRSAAIRENQDKELCVRGVELCLTVFLYFRTCTICAQHDKTRSWRRISSSLFLLWLVSAVLPIAIIVL